MPAIVEITVVGHDDVIRLMVLAGQQVVPILARALTETNQDIFRESQQQVPFRHGQLKASGRVSPPVFGVDIISMISYGNTAVAYAEYQHEGHRQDGTYQIRNYHNGKKGHYLSDPVQAAIPGMAASIARRLEAMLAQGGGLI